MTANLSAEPPVTEFVGQLFFRLWRASHVRATDVLETVGLTPPLFALLNVIGSRTGAIQQELGVVMGVDRSTMVSLIDELEGAGLAKRRPSATDRRAREITITPKGRRLLERARRLVTATEDEILSSLAPEERSQLGTLLRRALQTAPTQPLWSSGEAD